LCEITTSQLAVRPMRTSPTSGSGTDVTTPSTLIIAHSGGASEGSRAMSVSMSS
jgi:hypothetical protein